MSVRNGYSLDRRDKKLAGVCSTIGEVFNIDPTFVRIGFAAAATILAPGFKLGNVIVMAGVPSIMQAMMDIVAPKLKSGVRMLSDTVRANAREGDIGGPLREIAAARQATVTQVAIGWVLAREMGEDGIPVNAVMPGMVATPGTQTRPSALAGSFTGIQASSTPRR